MIFSLVTAILSVLRGRDGWNLLNLLRILNLEGIVKEFRGFCVVSFYTVAFWDNERIF
jgi:hypothetical protein